MITLPLKIAEFINANYPGKNYVNHKKEEDAVTGAVYYVVFLDDDEKCYRLKFNENGKCISEYSEPLQPDYNEQYY